MSVPELSIDGRAPRVVVTGAGGPAAVGLMRNATLAGIEWFAADIDPHAAGLHLVDADHRFLAKRADDPGFVDHLFDASVVAQADLVVPTVDAELLPMAAAVERFNEAGMKVLIAGGVSTLNTVLDKVLLADACQGIVPVPTTIALDESTDLSALSLPMIVKPRHGSGGRDVEIVTDPARLAVLAGVGDMLAQQLLVGEEYSVDVLARSDGSVAAAVPRARLKVDSGIAVAARTLHDDSLEGGARAVVEHLGLRGIVNVQFRRDEQGVAHLLEINPRLPGTMTITVASGVDMPYWFIAEPLGTSIPEGLTFEDRGVVRFWADQVIEDDAFARLAATGTPTSRGAIA